MGGLVCLTYLKIALPEPKPPALGHPSKGLDKAPIPNNPNPPRFLNPTFRQQRSSTLDFSTYTTVAMPPKLATSLLTLETAKLHHIDTRNVENLYSMWSGKNTSHATLPFLH